MEEQQGHPKPSTSRLPIDSSDELYRRIYKDWCKVENGVRVVSSAAFYSRSDPEPSVDLARLRTAAESVSGYPGHGLAGFFAGTARQLGLDIIHDPCPPYDPDNYAHSLVTGLSSYGTNQRRSKAKALARACHWVIPVPHVSDEKQ